MAVRPPHESWLTLKHLVRCYVNLVQDSTRVMLRIKALLRAYGIPTPGMSVYRKTNRKQWLAKLEIRGARLRAESLLQQLDYCSSCGRRRNER